MNNLAFDLFTEFIELGGEKIEKYIDGRWRCSWHTPPYGKQYATGPTLPEALQDALKAIKPMGASCKND
jgi:hypothetical protein